MSGVQWLEDLPASWTAAPPKALFGERREPASDGDRHLTPSQLYGVLPQDEYMRLTGNRVVQIIEGGDNMKHVATDDFVIHLRSFQGGIEHSPLAGKVSPAYTVLTPTAAGVPAFYRWVLKSDGYIQELRTTTNQLRDGQSIKFKDFAQVLLPLPPTREQQAIADYLDRENAQVDTLIAKQEQLIATLRERRIERVSALALRGFRPLSKAPRGSLPVGARFTVVLGKMLDAGRESGERDVELPYIRAANLQDSGLDLSSVNRMPFTPVETLRLDLKAGDLLVVEGGAVGTSVCLDDDLPGWGFQKTVNRVRAVGSDSTRWLGYVLRAYRDAGVIDIVCDGSTIAHFTAEKLRALQVPLLDPGDQRRVAEQLDDETSRIDTLIAKTEQFIALARERRSALITAAVTGQIDVKAAA